LKRIIEDLGEVLDGMVKISAVNCESSEELCEEQPQVTAVIQKNKENPVYLVFPSNSDKEDSIQTEKGRRP